MRVVATRPAGVLSKKILGTHLEETTAVPFEHTNAHSNVIPTYVTDLETGNPSRLLESTAWTLCIKARHLGGEHQGG